MSCMKHKHQSFARTDSRTGIHVPQVTGLIQGRRSHVNLVGELHKGIKHLT